jgi:hypothetical protein
MSKLSKIPQFREMICTRAVPYIQDPESHQTLFRSLHPRVSRSLRNPSQGVNFYGPVVLAEELLSSPLVQRNRDPYQHLPLRNRDLFLSPPLCLNRQCRNQGLFLHRLLHCRMAMHVARRQIPHAHRRHHHLHPRRLPPRR